MSIIPIFPRKLILADAAAYFAFRQQSLAESPWAFLSSPDDDRVKGVGAVEAFLAEEENDVLVIAEDGVGARILAAAGVMRQTRAKVRHRASIWGVYCRPECRGCGHGRAVVAAAVETAASWAGVEIVGLSVSARAEAAIGLYESLGFERWGVEADAIRVDGQAYDELHMMLKL